jgi:hypothetical protein
LQVATTLGQHNHRIEGAWPVLAWCHLESFQEACFSARMVAFMRAVTSQVLNALRNSKLLGQICVLSGWFTTWCQLPVQYVLLQNGLFFHVHTRNTACDK